MRAHHAAALCLLAGLALAAAASESAKPTDAAPTASATWLPDVLRPQAKKTMYAEEETACLRFTRGTECQCTSQLIAPFCRHQLQIHDVGCCNGAARGGGAFGRNSVPTVGSCTWVADYILNINSPPAAGDSAALAGTASFTCELTSRAEGCGSPLCEGMTITGWGKMYYVASTPQAPLFTLGPAAPYVGFSDGVTDGCGGAYLRTNARIASDDAAHTAAATAGPTQARQAAAGAAGYGGYDSYDRDQPAPLYYYPTVNATVFVGSFYVVDPSHGAKSLTGTLQYTSNPINVAGAQPVDMLPPGAMVFNPWALEMRFPGSFPKY